MPQKDNHCPGCKAEVQWAHAYEGGKLTLPVNPPKGPKDGTYAIRRDQDGVLRYRWIGVNGQARPGETRAASHLAACPVALDQRNRRKPVPKEGVQKTQTTIRQRYEFSASHLVSGLSDGDPEGSLHGHDFIATLTLRSAGMTITNEKLDAFRSYISRTLDHKHLGDGDLYDAHGKIAATAVVSFNPTLGSMATYLLHAAAEIFGGCAFAVEVRETKGPAVVASRAAKPS